jgi:DNA recombination protein RmuC
VKRQLETASRTIDQAEVRTRAMAGKLKAVEELPEAEAKALFSLPATPDPDAAPPEP